MSKAMRLDQVEARVNDNQSHDDSGSSYGLARTKDPSTSCQNRQSTTNSLQHLQFLEDFCTPLPKKNYHGPPPKIDDFVDVSHLLPRKKIRFQQFEGVAHLTVKHQSSTSSKRCFSRAKASKKYVSEDFWHLKTNIFCM